MKEYIEKNSLLALVRERVNALRKEYGDYDHYTSGYDDCVDQIENFPAAEVVEVVRCKDCIRFVDNKEAFVTYCRRGLNDITVRPDDYCSYGERNDTERKID